MGHHVHGPDAQHSAVHIVAVEHMVHVMVFLLTVEEDFFFPVLLQILAGRHQEAAGAAGRVANHIVRPRGHQVHHHADDVPGGAELAVDPGGGDFGQEVFVDVAPDISIVELLRLGVNFVHGGDDLIQHQRRGDLENGVSHVLGVGAVLVGVEVLDEGEHPLLHDGIHLSGGKVVEHRPFELATRDGPLPHLYLTGKDALMRQAQHGTLLGPLVIGGIQVVDEHEVGHLFHHIQGIRYAAGPEGLPEAVNFIFQFASDHVLLLLFPVPDIGGIASAAEF